MELGTVKYSENGLWIKKEADVFVIGLSEKGQDDIGEVAFVDLPETGELKVDGVLLGAEGAKAVTELTSPISGDIVEVHTELEDKPELLNSTKAEDNWIVKLTSVDEAAVAKLADESGL